MARIVTMMGGLFLAGMVGGTLSASLAPTAVDPADFPRRDVDARTARVVVYFENPVALGLFDADRAADYVNARFTTSIDVDKRGQVTYGQFADAVRADPQSRDVYALVTSGDVVSWQDGHAYEGLAVRDFGVMFVSGQAAFKLDDGQYRVFAHEIGHLLEGAAHSPYEGNLMSVPIGGDHLCKCQGDPYAKWAR